MLSSLRTLKPIKKDSRIGMPPTPITIRIEKPENSESELGPIQGFKFFWAYYVNGFDQTVHCQPCFKGSLSKQFNTRTVQTGRQYIMNERKAFRYLYICGVGLGPKNRLRERNFHLALEGRAGTHEIRQTYNGYKIIVENGVALPIPDLEAGWNGLDLETTRCKNFRFAVAHFGWTD
jgi:hypothetical protein